MLDVFIWEVILIFNRSSKHTFTSEQIFIAGPISIKRKFYSLESSSTSFSWLPDTSLTLQHVLSNSDSFYTQLLLRPEQRNQLKHTDVILPQTFHYMSFIFGPRLDATICFMHTPGVQTLSSVQQRNSTCSSTFSSMCLTTTISSVCLCLEALCGSFRMCLMNK